MAENSIELEIERLAGLGDGMGMWEGRKVFVPYTAAGDRVTARIVRKTSDALYGTLETVITPSASRATPPCKHFGTCGGCTLQHLQPTAYAAFKQQMAQEAVRKAGFDPAITQPLVTFSAASRRRVELKIATGNIGFYAANSHRIVDMHACAIMEPELFALVMEIKRQLPQLPRISSMQINGVDGGYDIAAEGDDARRLQLADCASVKRISVRRNSGYDTVFQSGNVTMSLGDVSVAVPPGAFLQASQAAQEHMTQLVSASAKNAGSVLDLFAGIGTYSFPVNRFAAVTAIEGDKAMTEAMKTAATKHRLPHPFRAETRDLFHYPVAAKMLESYDAVIINPPRAGAKAQTEQIAQSSTARVIMVSCNPATFARDARMLKEGGYKLTQLTPVDQFAYSAHLELVAEFNR